MSPDDFPRFCERCQVWIHPSRFVHAPDSREAQCPVCSSRLFRYGPYPRNVPLPAPRVPQEAPHV